MDYTEDHAQAAKNAEKAFAEMQRRGIVMHPNNFMIWYTFVTETMPDLNRAIEILEENDQTLDEPRCAEIYAKYFSNQAKDAAVAAAANKLSDQVDSVLNDISAAGGDVGAYGTQLDGALQALSGISGTDDAKAVITSALSTTRDMAAKNAVLETQLQSTSDEISRLREDLEALRQEAYTDGLTGIANRKRFDQMLRQNAISAMETGAPLSLLMIDIDHFKKFNDTFGHQVGDQVLRLLAATLRENVKGQDTPARYGGEEFAIILPNTTQDDAVTVAELVRNAINSKVIRNRNTGADLGRITISIGVSTFRPGEPVTQVISRADQALYAAKRGGRDRVCTERDLETSDVTFSAR